MDISSISGSYQASVATQIRREEAETGSFQSVLDKAVKDKDQAELKKACVDFEGYFLQMVFKEMRKTVNSEGGVFPKSQAEGIFQEMLDEEVSKKSAEAGGTGLADMMYNQLSRELS